jgi:hypothetical protein
MPARTVQPSPGHRVFEFTCDTCGGPASFGEGVNLREALRSGDVSKAGRWFCGFVEGRAVCIGKGRAAPADLGRVA